MATPDITECSDKELFDTLYEAYRKLPLHASDPQARWAVWEEIFPLTNELQRRYPVPDYRPPQQ
jgi:hypothetical protein